MGTIEEYQAAQSRKHDVIIGRLKAELVQAQQALTQSREEMITRYEHQKVVKQLKDMSTTESETYAELTRSQKEIKKMQSRFEKSLDKSRRFVMFTLMQSTLDPLPPIIPYS